MLAYRELDDALGLTDLARGTLSECRHGRNTRHLLAGLLRRSVFGRLSGYQDVTMPIIWRMIRPCFPGDMYKANVSRSCTMTR